MAGLTTYRTLGRQSFSEGGRSIRSGHRFNKFFPTAQLKGTDPIVMDGSVFDTLRQMEKIVRRTLNQTAAISKELKSRSLQATLANIFEFIYTHIQYKLDLPIREQLREPARTWADRKSGVDCDCYSIFISSILTNLGIPHAFRMADYGEGYQHVYVVVPKDGRKASLSTGNYYTVDPVLDRFNAEKPFTKKHDRTMEIQVLNGINGQGQSLAGCGCQQQGLLGRLGDMASITKNELLEYLREIGLLPIRTTTALPDGGPIGPVTRPDGSEELVSRQQSKAGSIWLGLGLAAVIAGALYYGMPSEDKPKSRPKSRPKKKKTTATKKSSGKLGGTKKVQVIEI
jgi:hypothetical protein